MRGDHHEPAEESAGSAVAEVVSDGKVSEDRTDYVGGEEHGHRQPGPDPLGPAAHESQRVGVPKPAPDDQESADREEDRDRRVAEGLVGDRSERVVPAGEPEGVRNQNGRGGAEPEQAEVVAPARHCPYGSASASDARGLRTADLLTRLARDGALG